MLVLQTGLCDNTRKQPSWLSFSCSSRAHTALTRAYPRCIATTGLISESYCIGTVYAHTHTSLLELKCRHFPFHTGSIVHTTLPGTLTSKMLDRVLAKEMANETLTYRFLSCITPHSDIDYTSTKHDTYFDVAKHDMVFIAVDRA